MASAAYGEGLKPLPLDDVDDLALLALVWAAEEERSALKELIRFSQDHLLAAPPRTGS